MPSPTREWLAQQLHLLAHASDCLVLPSTIESWADHLYGNWAQLEVADTTKVISEWVDSYAVRASQWPNMAKRAAISSLAEYLVERR